MQDTSPGPRGCFAPTIGGDGTTSRHEREHGAENVILRTVTSSFTLTTWIGQYLKKHRNRIKLDYRQLGETNTIMKQITVEPEMETIL